MQEEIHCDSVWAERSFMGSVALVKEKACLTTPPLPTREVHIICLCAWYITHLIN